MLNNNGILEASSLNNQGMVKSTEMPPPTILIHENINVRPIENHFSNSPLLRVHKTKEEDLIKKQEALRLLLKSDQKKKKKIQKVIDHKMEIVSKISYLLSYHFPMQERERVRMENAEKTLDKYALLKKIEESRELDVMKKISLLQHNSFNVYMSKVNLIKKLTEIEGMYL